MRLLLKPARCTSTCVSASRRFARRALTLLEVILTLSLAVVLVGLVGMAVSLQLRAVDHRRADVEQAQLARAILRGIANDLSGAVPYTELDFSALEQMLPTISTASLSGTGTSSPTGTGTGASGSGSSGSGGTSGGGTGSGGAGQGAGGQSSSGQGGGGQAAAGQGAGGQGSTGQQPSGPTSGGQPTGGSATSGQSSSGQSTTGQSSTGQTSGSTSYLADATTLPAMPGLYGNQFELQLDVSRLPGQRYGAPSTPSPWESPSDLKTVTYYVASPNTPGVSSELAGAFGLVRRSVDRAVAQFATENGDPSALAQASEVIAPEVVWLEFSYFDGAEWLSEWNTESQGGLPVAIEILIALADPNDPAAADPTAIGAAAAPTGPQRNAAPAGPGVYRMVVRLPNAEPTSSLLDPSQSQVLP